MPTAHADTVVTAADAPTLVVGAPVSRDGIQVSWVAPVSNGGSPVTSYTVEYSKDSEFIPATTTVVKTLNANVTATFTGLAPATPKPFSVPTYFFRISATNVAGASTFTDPIAVGLPYVFLGAATRFIASGSAVVNVGASTMTGNGGLDVATPGGYVPGSSLAGVGTVHIADVDSTNVSADILTAYNVTSALPGVLLTSPILETVATLTPGVYDNPLAAELRLIASGTLTFDAQGDPNAVFVVRTDSSAGIFIGADAKILLARGAQAENIYWLSKGAVVLGARTVVAGTFISLSAIGLGTDSSIDGQFLSTSAGINYENDRIIHGSRVYTALLRNLDWSDDGLGAIAVGRAYVDGVTAVAVDVPATPVTYELLSGVLPDGLTLNPLTGAIIGPPTKVGTFTFLLQASAENHTPTTLAFTVTVTVDQAALDAAAAQAAAVEAARLAAEAANRADAATPAATPPAATPPAAATVNYPVPAASISPANRPVPDITNPDIGHARVIYRMKKNGRWEIHPAYRSAARVIPANALFTPVRSPINGQSKNIRAAAAKALNLAKANTGRTHKVIPGVRWRGAARIIVNW